MAKRSGRVGGQPHNTSRLGGHRRFITEALVRKLHEECLDPRLGATPAEKKIRARKVEFMVDTMVKLAMNGDTACLKMVCDRVEGQSIQAVEFKPTLPMTPEEAQAAETKKLSLTHEALEKMTPNERSALYLQTLKETNRIGGSA